MTTHTIANMLGAGTDSRVFFRRPEDNSIYAIIGPKHMRELKRSNQLYKHLKKQRESGVVIQFAKE